MVGILSRWVLTIPDFQSHSSIFFLVLTYHSTLYLNKQSRAWLSIRHIAYNWRVLRCICWLKCIWSASSGSTPMVLTHIICKGHINWLLESELDLVQWQHYLSKYWSQENVFFKLSSGIYSKWLTWEIDGYEFLDRLSYFDLKPNYPNELHWIEFRICSAELHWHETVLINEIRCCLFHVS